MPTLPHCPACNARMVPTLDGDDLWCQFCGTTRRDPDAQQAVREFRAAVQAFSEYDPPYRDYDMDPDLRLALTEAWQSVQADDLTSARFVLDQLRTRFADCADVWYLLALTAGNTAEKRNYLNQALDLQPYHEYAWREQGVMDGVITPGDAPPPSEDASDGSVDAQSETYDCPLCGGALAFDAALGALICGHCGHRSGALPVVRGSPRGYQKLEHALLQRRFGFTREWHIGERVLVCQNCAAQLTLTGTTLSTQCPFCDSAHVLIRDAAGTFEEPAALLPFVLDQSAAARAIHARLPAGMNSQIERGEFSGVYLPFWAFAGMTSVMIPPGAPRLEALQTGLFSASDVLVSGAAQPRQATLYELMPYDLDALARYEARYLAHWPAQIYSVDVIQASITGRAYLKYAARRAAMGYPVSPEVALARTDSAEYNPPDSPLWRVAGIEVVELSYRLLLLPVWMITLVQRGGTRLPAMVNGQTGEAILLGRFDDGKILAGPNRPPAAPLPIIPLPRRNVIRPITRPKPRSSVIRPIAPPKPWR